jgi:hypothetical protein
MKPTAMATYVRSRPHNSLGPGDGRPLPDWEYQIVMIAAGSAHETAQRPHPETVFTHDEGQGLMIDRGSLDLQLSRHTIPWKRVTQRHDSITYNNFRRRIAAAAVIVVERANFMVRRPRATAKPSVR